MHDPTLDPQRLAEFERIQRARVANQPRTLTDDERSAFEARRKIVLDVPFNPERYTISRYYSRPFPHHGGKV